MHEHSFPTRRSSDLKRIAAPMVGGVITSTILELIIYPAIYMIWKGRTVNNRGIDNIDSHHISFD
jgi:hypothetical protein